MRIYNLHSPKDNFYGCDNPSSLEDLKIIALSMGLNMISFFIENGLNIYEEQNPEKAVIFDVETENVIMI